LRNKGLDPLLRALLDHDAENDDIDLYIHILDSSLSRALRSSQAAHSDEVAA